MRVLVLALGFALAACGPDYTPCDASVPPEVDMAKPPEAPKPDLATPPDLASPPDLSEPPCDLAKPGCEGEACYDLSRPPCQGEQCQTPPDLACQPPDLSQPRCTCDKDDHKSCDADSGPDDDSFCGCSFSGHGKGTGHCKGKHRIHSQGHGNGHCRYDCD